MKIFDFDSLWRAAYNTRIIVLKHFISLYTTNEITFCGTIHLNVYFS